MQNLSHRQLFVDVENLEEEKASPALSTPKKRLVEILTIAQCGRDKTNVKKLAGMKKATARSEFFSTKPFGVGAEG